MVHLTLFLTTFALRIHQGDFYFFVFYSWHSRLNYLSLHMQLLVQSFPWLCSLSLKQGFLMINKWWVEKTCRSFLDLVYLKLLKLISKWWYWKTICHFAPFLMCICMYLYFLAYFWKVCQFRQLTKKRKSKSDSNNFSNNTNL